MENRFGMYLRKSTDSEDRQVQSIEDQRRELNKIINERSLDVTVGFDESKSAKQPGRPKFDELIRMVESGKIDSIICWKLNRLARNPIDGGKIQWLLQTGILKSIVTPSKTYLPTDNMLMMAVELGMATQFVLDLSKDVKRGMKTKMENGWMPTRAPVGYINEKYADKGKKRILKDEAKFPIVRKMWDCLLTGAYTVPKILDIANEQLGIRNYRGEKFGLSGLYKLFNNPFYLGEFIIKGERYQGSHEAMITPEEFDRAQLILGVRGQPRPKNKRLPFTGIIQCGECGGMITAEEKVKTRKTGTKRYLYHHCSRRKKDKKCYQASINHPDLVKQINEVLDSIAIEEDFLYWAIDVLREQNKLEAGTREKILGNQQKNYQNVLQSISNLINTYISPGNADRSLISDEEFKNQKNGLVQEKNRLEIELKGIGERANDWLELSEKTFHFATYAKVWFEKGDPETKTEILRALGDNIILKDRKLSLKLSTPYFLIKKSLEKARLEQSSVGLGTTKNSLMEADLSVWSG